MCSRCGPTAPRSKGYLNRKHKRAPESHLHKRDPFHLARHAVVGNGAARPVGGLIVAWGPGIYESTSDGSSCLLAKKMGSLTPGPRSSWLGHSDRAPAFCFLGPENTNLESGVRDRLPCSCCWAGPHPCGARRKTRPGSSAGTSLQAPARSWMQSWGHMGSLDALGCAIRRAEFASARKKASHAIQSRSRACANHHSFNPSRSKAWILGPRSRACQKAFRRWHGLPKLAAAGDQR